MNRQSSALCVIVALALGCGPAGGDAHDAGAHEDAGVDVDAGIIDDGSGDAGWIDACGNHRPNVFLNSVVSFDAGTYAGFGQEKMPCIVQGPPIGCGPNCGSLDVVSLGYEGTIVVSFDDVEIVDGTGVDFIVFENPFPGWIEPGYVAVSDDGENWTEFPCDPQNVDGGYPGCAGVHPVLSNPSNGLSPTDPTVAGGDQYDLADIGVTQARFLRIRDSGFSHYGGTTGGFDLDAAAAVHSVPRNP